MKFKKTISMLLAAMAVMGLLVGCNTAGSDPAVTDSGRQSETEITTMAETKSTPNTDESRLGYLVVTEHGVRTDGSTDVTEALQTLINENPNRTLFFPDGTYLIRKPITTSGDPTKSVSLQLSNYAIILADRNYWTSKEAMIRLGAQDSKTNNSERNGSNWFFKGGIVNGAGVANGISIDGGREVVISGVAIKNTPIGIHVKFGINGGSSDADISSCNIIGTGTKDSKGIFVEGYDNTFTNIRIGKVHIGVHLRGAANKLTNIHPLYYSDYSDYADSCGFWDEWGTNWFDFCYSDHFRVGFRLAHNAVSFFNNCYVFWYEAKNASGVSMTKDYVLTAFQADGDFSSIVTVFRAGFRRDAGGVAMLSQKSANGTGVFENVSVDCRDLLTDDPYHAYERK